MCYAFDLFFSTIKITMAGQLNVEMFIQEIVANF